MYYTLQPVDELLKATYQQEEKWIQRKGLQSKENYKHRNEQINC